MDMELAPQNYYVVQGYIDAKDDRGKSVNGTFISVVSRHDVKYTSVLFGQLDMNNSMGWRDLLPLHEDAEKEPDRDPLMLHHEEGLYKYLETSLLLTSVAKNMNTKQVEQAVSRFCLEHLKLKAVCFANFANAGEDDLKLFPKEVMDRIVGNDNTGESERDSSEVRAAEKPKEDKEIFIRCEPILDPIGGVAMNELPVGDNVYGKLASDSVIYKLLAKNNRHFDGTILAQVSGILMNDLGTATVSLTLSDGVAGVMKLSGKVRVKTAPNQRDGTKPSGARRRLLRKISPFSLPPEFIFTAAGIVVAIAALSLVYYIFSS
jgi:hypothetical protein